MIRDLRVEQPELPGLDTFETPFQAALDPDNRWVRWAAHIPWTELAAGYQASLSPTGRPAKPARLVIGALIIKHRLKLSDAETIEQLRENPYLQYFCGFERYQREAAFAPTLFVKIRERLTAERFAVFEQAIIDRMVALEDAPAAPSPNEDLPSDDTDTPSGGASAPAPEVNAGTGDGVVRRRPEGTLIVDASVAEQQIRYPHDVALLNTAREQSEQLLDALWAALNGPDIDLAWGDKPRSYRQRARHDYLSFSKKRARGAKAIRRARRQQLQYLRRNLGHLDRLLDLWPKPGFPLPYRQQRQLWVIRELYSQQRHMHEHNTRRIDHRIVSLHQPRVRPIVRGRLGHPVEFGAKFSVAQSNGIACVDALRWDAYHEASDLIDHCEAYRQRYGHYPAKVLADGLYGTRANRRWLKDHGIDFGGKPLGRPPKLTQDQQRRVTAQRRQDARDRIPIEGKFGQGKNGYGLNKIKARRPDTSEAWIRSIFLVMNLIRLAALFCCVRIRGAALAQFWSWAFSGGLAWSTHCQRHALLVLEAQLDRHSPACRAF